MPSGAVAYKQPAKTYAEPLPVDGRLLDHIRAATLLFERMHAGRPTPVAPSAVVVRPPDGDPVVVVLVDRQAGVLPAASELCRRFDLTPRESEVALLLADRLSCREIAGRLGTSFHTARSHTERVLDKLGIRSKKEVRNCLSASRPVVLAGPWPQERSVEE